MKKSYFLFLSCFVLASVCGNESDTSNADAIAALDDATVGVSADGEDALNTDIGALGDDVMPPLDAVSDIEATAAEVDAVSDSNASSETDADTAADTASESVTTTSASDFSTKSSDVQTKDEKSECKGFFEKIKEKVMNWFSK